MIIVPFIESHLEGFEVHKDLSHIQEYLNEDYARLLAACISYTAIADGKVIGIAGVLNAGKGRFLAWALLTKESGKYMIPITREARKFLDSFDAKRIETPVKHDFEIGHKWMKLLGFKNETPDGMKNYDNGVTFDLYARVNG